MRHRHFLRLLLTSLLSLSVLLILAWTPYFFQAPAALGLESQQAHAFVIGSDPVDGSTISTAPTTIRIFFNADISPASIAQVYAFAPGSSPDGRLVNGGRSTIPTNNARELDTPLLSPSTLPQGSYEVKWTAVATDDGDATHGLIGFNLGYSVTGLSGTPILGPITSNILPQLTLQGILSIMWDWLTFLALIFWIGIVAMEGLLLLGVGASPDASHGGIIVSLIKQGRPLQWLCLAALLVGEIINLILRGALLKDALALSGVDLAALRQLVLETNYGHLWLTRVGLICLALIFLWWTIREQNETQPPSSQSRAGASSQARAGASSQARAVSPQTRAGASPTPTLLRNGLRSRIGYGRGLPPPWSSLQSRIGYGSPWSSLQSRIGYGSPWSKNRFSKLRQEVAAAEVAAAIEEQSAEQEDTSKPDKETIAAPSSTQSSANVDAINRVPTTVPRWHTIAWLILAGLILLTIAFSGDTAQLAQQHTSAVVLNWLQLLAQAVWFGGAAYLGFVLLPLLPANASDSQGELLVNALRSYTPLLLAALGALLISVLFLTETTISDASQWLNDPYGRALLVNILLLILMVIFTGYSFFYLLPKLRRQIILLPVVDADLPARRTRRSVLEQTGSSLKRAMHILAILGAGVLLCAALMDFFAPPIVFPPLNTNNTASAANPTKAPIIQTQQVGNLSISLEVTPAQADASNTVIITLKDNSGNPVTDVHVRISTNMELMDMGTARKDLLAQAGSSTYVAVFNASEAFSMSGAWDITLSIQRPNSAPVQARFVVTLTS